MLEAYATPDFADEYFASIGNAKWPKTPAVIAPTDPEGQPDSREHDAMMAKKTAALTQASLWLDNIAFGKWKGKKTAYDQALAWPRSGVVVEDHLIPSDTTPASVKYACCEAAVRIIRGADLSPDMERGGAIKSEKIGPIETEYFDGAPAETKYTVIENLLAGLLETSLFEEAGTSGKVGSIYIERA